MAEYVIHFVASAAREYRSLPVSMKSRVAVAVERLRETARPSGVRKLRGHQFLYRIRVGDYRIIYEINDELRTIRVTRVRHRGEVFR